MTIPFYHFFKKLALLLGLEQLFLQVKLGPVVVVVLKVLAA